MKKSLFFMPLVAALALTGCSSDEPISPNGNFDGSYDGQAYMRVRIAMPGDGTRATDGGFEDGTEAENKIKTIGLKFYNADGSFYGYGLPVQDPEITQNPDGTAIEAHTTEAVIVLQINNNAPKPTHVVAFVNCGDDWREAIGAEPDITNIDKTLNRIATKYDDDNKEYFAMTSSNFAASGSDMLTYVEGYKTSIAAENFCTTVDDAENTSPITIYVERLAAKVQVNKAPNLDSNNPEITNGSYKLQFVIDGYALGGLNQESYLIKHIIQGWTNDDALWPGWNDRDNRRCYWAEDMNYDNSFIPKLDYESYNSAMTNYSDNTLEGKPMYSHENTLTTFLTSPNTDNLTGKPKLYEETKAPNDELNRYLYQEFVYVMGHYVVTDENGTAVTNPYLYEYAGKILPENVLATYMTQNLSNTLYTMTETGTGQAEIYTSANLMTIKVGEEQVPLIEIGSYQYTETDKEYNSADDTKKDASLVCLHLTDAVTDEVLNEELGKYYVKNPSYNPSDPMSDQYIKANKANVEPLLKQSSVQAYGFKYTENINGVTGNNGYLAYYPILIKHLNSGPGKSESFRGYYGVVRNHIYNITINSIKGIGIGIYDPTVDIIPKDKLKPLYLGATFNILSWKVVNQTEDLNQ